MRSSAAAAGLPVFNDFGPAPLFWMFPPQGRFQTGSNSWCHCDQAILQLVRTPEKKGGVAFVNCEQKVIDWRIWHVCAGGCYIGVEARRVSVDCRGGKALPALDTIASAPSYLVLLPSLPFSS